MTWGRDTALQMLGGGSLLSPMEVSVPPPPRFGSVCAPGLEGARIQPSDLPGLNLGAHPAWGWVPHPQTTQILQRNPLPQALDPCQTLPV